MTGSALNPTNDMVLEWFTKPMTSRPIVAPIFTMTIPIDDDIYVCQVCGHEDHPDRFGRVCPRCGTDLDEGEEIA